MRAKKTLKRRFDVVIIGGLGHVGLPLGLVFAEEGLKVCLYDTHSGKAGIVRSGRMPFIEYGAQPILKKALSAGTLEVSTEMRSISAGSRVIIALGTPLDEYHNPKTRSFLEMFLEFKKHLDPGQTIIVRSTVYPHTCRQISKLLGGGRPWRIAYCPERIAQGYAVRELRQLPQIISGLTEDACRHAAELFGRISPKVIRVSLEEAELIKLFTNAWRYIQFAAANQFYMIARNYGVDYDKIRRAMVEGYDRAKTLPAAGFAAGPCLFKDTMQLASFYGNNFQLGQAAVMINEGLPGFLVEELRKTRDLGKTAVGILGMAFKADVDDIRDSLSYKLGKILRFYGAKVFYSDEHVKDPTFVSKEKLIASSDVIIIGAPHSRYKGLVIPRGKEVVDLWGVTAGRGK